MDDQPNLHEFLNEVSNFAEEAPVSKGGSASASLTPIGQVVEIAGSGSQIRMDAAALNGIQSHKDPSIAMSGQVGSQVKMTVGDNWLIANVRTMRGEAGGEVVALVDFLGEGTRAANGQLGNFRRGVTPHPIPGAAVHPTSTEDLRAVLSADDEAHVEVSNGYQSDDISVAMYVDRKMSNISDVLRQ